MILVNYKKPNLLVIPGVRKFGPGVNEVDEKEWARCEKFKLVQHLVEEGLLEVEGAKDTLSLPPAKAVKLVKDTVDQDLLAKWAEQDTRPAVQKAIKAQQEAFKKAAEPKGEGDAAGAEKDA